MEEYALLSKLIQITNADMHTFDIVYTDDMRGILRFAEGDMEIIEGRVLTKADSAKGSSCVISREFAEANDLHVGNTITIKLGTELFEQHKALGAVAVTWERYAPPVKTVTLEIIGIYADVDNVSIQATAPHLCYSVNTIFVPMSLLPADDNLLSNHVFSPAEVALWSKTRGTFLHF